MPSVGLLRDRQKMGVPPVVSVSADAVIRSHSVALEPHRRDGRVLPSPSSTPCRWISAKLHLLQAQVCRRSNMIMMIGCPLHLPVTRSCMLVVVMTVAAVWAASRGTGAQVYTAGQNIAPVYEGWEQNPDGSFNLVFGYFNRNWEEEIDLPIGPNNNIEAGGPDQGQPTHFLPGRNRFLFRVRVPKDFGAKELVWTLTSHGKTE